MERQRGYYFDKKTGVKTKLQSKGNYTPCPKCGEYYLQAVYMRIKRKWVKIGEGCPECLKKELEKENRELKGEW